MTDVPGPVRRFRTAPRGNPTAPPPRGAPVDPSKPVQAVKDAVESVAEKAADLVSPRVPGTPGSAPATLEEPTTPKPPLPPKSEQGQPDTRTPTGAETGAPAISAAQQ